MTTNNREDELLLVSRAKQGDREAFDQLMALYDSWITACVQKWIKTPALVPDGVAVTKIKAWKGIHRFQGRSKFSTWLFRVSFSGSMDVLRRTFGRNGPKTFFESPPSQETRPIELSAEQLEVAGKLMETDIPVSAAMLVWQERYSFEDCADELGLDLDKVERIVSRGMKKLRSALKLG